jgi:NitT/TauT family transport system ATP-binding protein
MHNDSVILHVTDISKTYYIADSEPVEALRNVSLDIQQGSFFSFLGPSGCGKTTLLKIIAGLLEPTSGNVEILHTQNKPGPDIMFVFQEYNRSLFPWRNVFRNAAFGLEQLGLPKKEIKERVFKYLEIVKLNDFAYRYPWELSGGMQQRVAIARALVCEPQFLLMDEPFGSLDALSRTMLEDDLLRVWQDLNLTVLFVTHDIDEAIYLSDKVVVLSQRPSYVLKNICIDIQRPRHQIETKNSAEFGIFRAEISQLLGRNNHAKTQVVR